MWGLVGFGGFSSLVCFLGFGDFGFAVVVWVFGLLVWFGCHRLSGFFVLRFVAVQIFTFGVCLCCCVGVWFGVLGVGCRWFWRFLVGVLISLWWAAAVGLLVGFVWLRKLLSLCAFD